MTAQPQDGRRGGLGNRLALAFSEAADVTNGSRCARPLGEVGPLPEALYVFGQFIVGLRPLPERREDLAPSAVRQFVSGQAQDAAGLGEMLVRGLSFEGQSYPAEECPRPERKLGLRVFALRHLALLWAPAAFLGASLGINPAMSPSRKHDATRRSTTSVMPCICSCPLGPAFCFVPHLLPRPCPDKTCTARRATRASALGVSLNRSMNHHDPVARFTSRRIIRV